MYFVFIIALLGAVKCQKEKIEATLANVPEDGILNGTQLLEKYGHKAVVYKVTTKDGYILDLFNVPGNRKKVVLFSHGLFDSADGWIIRGNASLAIIVADAGYDVWLMNYRGNRYARSHKTLDPDKDSDFWDYSAHEFATFDLAACIDLVLKVTGQKQLSIIGFSEGTTAPVILAATQPEYNDKVKVFVAMAPVVFMENVRSSLLGFIVRASPFLDFILPPSVNEVVGFYSVTKAILNLLCTQLVIGYELCYQGGMNAVSGHDPVGIDRDFFPTVVAHFPAGTSRKNLMHYAQISLRQKFALYDYGSTKNMNMYRTLSPPEYNVTRVTMRTVLLSGKNDPVSNLADVELLKNKLPNLEKHIVVERDTFNHLAHMWADDAPVIEYPFIMKILAEHNK